MALKPIFAKFDYDADHWVWGLNEDDFHKVQQGYACGRCLEDFGGIYLARCPVCKEEINVVVETPEEWRAHAGSHARP